MFHVKEKVSCTASIIAPSWLLSSSSCISSISNSPQEWVVFAGPPTQELDMEYTQIMIVREILHHPAVRHHQHLVSPDLALVSLHHPFSFAQAGVGAACLQQEEEEGEEEECLVVGWSRNTTGISFSQEVLQVTGDSWVSSAQCNSSRGYSGHLPSNTLCVENIGCDVSQSFSYYILQSEPTTGLVISLIINITTI